MDLAASPADAAPRLARRLQDVPTAATVAMTVKARAMRAQGLDVISLTIGEPDFPSPPEAIEAAHAAALAGQTKYPPQDGLPVLKQAIQRKFLRDSGLEYGLDELMVGNGGKQVIFDALLATLDPGDEVVVPAPYWGAYPLMVRLAGGVPVVVPCAQEDGFLLRPESLEAAISSRTKWLILNYPNNPSGAVCPAETLLALGEVMRRHPQVWILCDDIYEHLMHDGGRHATLAAVEPRLRDRVLTLSGVSKTYAMTGWRVGFAGGPRPLIQAMVRMQGHATAGVCSISQAAAAAALDGTQEAAGLMRAAYRRRRDLVFEALRDAPGLECHRPDGAFYAFPSCGGLLGRRSAAGRLLDGDEAVCDALLEEQHVAVVAGAAFGMTPYLRLSFATDDAALAEACRRITAFCKGAR